MNRTFVSFPIADFEQTKLKMLNWASRFNIFCLLDNHQYPVSHHTHECLLAAGAMETIEAVPGNAFEQLKNFSLRHHDWLFGHFSYALTAETETVASGHPDHIGFPALFLFVPEIVVELSTDHIRIGSMYADHERLFAIIQQTVIAEASEPGKAIEISPVFSEEEYKETINRLRSHILRGDCYEINFCQDFFANDAALNAVKAYQLLSAVSPAPFAAFYRLHDKYLLCASPERYLCREGHRLTSQPIKGTWPRDHKNPGADEQQKQDLFQSAKDRSENVMVVDLVRNDLSKICAEGTVQVDELFGIYTFPQVHQMISSVSGEQKTDMHWTDLIKATFPMGSMTGAPKKRVVELIERYERSARGIFSGAVGYIAPGGDFDFNVVIRSIQYNKSSRYLSYQVGSGITFYSDAQKEYEECLLKASAIKKVLAVSGVTGPADQ